MRIRSRIGLIALAALALAAPPLTAQGRIGGPLAQLLRDAARLESQGDLDGAELALRSLLEADPTAAGGLFALERILRAKGELEGLLPLLDGFLDREADAGVRGLRLQVMGETGSPGAVVAEGERWIAELPTDESTYQEVARAYRESLGIERALEVLRRGRSALGEGSLALEIGDLLAAVGDIDGAVDEWASAVGPTGSDAQAVRRRVQSLTEGRIRASRRLVGILGASERSLQRGAAARIAIELRLGPESLELSQRYASDLQGRARASFLEDVGRMSGEAELGSVAAWAYQELRDDASSPGERRQLDLRIVDSAIEVGDTATALAAQRRIAASYSRESDEGRRAAAQVIRLEVASAEPDRLRMSFLDFQRAFPDAPELDGLAATVSAGLRAGGDMEGAAAVLMGINGPRSALESAYLLLEGGDLERGRSMLLLAVSGLPPSEATPVIQLTNLLGRVSDSAAQALVTAGVEAHRGRGAQAALVLAGEAPEMSPGDRAPLLAEAARMADQGEAPELAVQIRERILEHHSNAPEVSEASLALARHHAEPGGDRAEAVRLLEELITRNPNAAVAPDARLELERLRERGS